MKVTKPFWLNDVSYSMEPYFVCLDFPSLFSKW